jgi:non-lysosomal glucosylceramidase
MFYSGMVAQGTEYIENVRARFDGVRRNPWDECEAGHHYVRAMASWSSVVALSGFHYEGDRAHVIAIPPIAKQNFRCFWATGTGWGSYSLQRAARGGVRFRLTVLAGSLPCSSCELDASGSQVAAKAGEDVLVARTERKDASTVVHFADRVQLAIGQQLAIDISA